MKRHRGKQGFSLIELAVVMAIIGTLAAVGIPTMVSYLSTWRLNAAGRDIYNALVKAKSTAIRHNAQCVVEFTPGAYSDAGGVGSYRIFLDIDRDWTDQNAVGGDEQVFMQTTVMPGRVSLYQASFTNNGNGQGTATRMAGFDSRGRAARAGGGTFVSGVICLRNDENHYRRITLTPVGSLFLEKSSDGNTWVQ